MLRTATTAGLRGRADKHDSTHIRGEFLSTEDLLHMKASSGGASPSVLLSSLSSLYCLVAAIP